MPNKFTGLLEDPPKLLNWRSCARAPYVYDKVPEDKSSIVLNEKRFEALKRAVYYIEKGSSYRDAATWLSAATGKSITREGLFFIHKKYLAEKKLKISEKRLETNVKKSIIKAINDAKRVTPSAPIQEEGKTEDSSNPS